MVIATAAAYDYITSQFIVFDNVVAFTGINLNIVRTTILNCVAAVKSIDYDAVRLVGISVVKRKFIIFIANKINADSGTIHDINSRCFCVEVRNFPVSNIDYNVVPFECSLVRSAG